MHRYSWYNCIASVYDYFTILPYKKIRTKAISKLNITLGDTVVDLGCGTGLNLEELSQFVGKEGTVIAVEPSKGMLNQAKKKADKFHLKNIVFIEKTISEYVCSDDSLKYSAPNLKVISILVASVIPCWEKDLKDLIDALPQGSQFIIMDLFSNRKTFVSSFIDKVAQANTNRKSWFLLKDTLSNFTLSWYKIPFYFGVKAFIATGIKNA